jgi:hypothetical protein
MGAFDGDELVGYSINIVSKNLHYSDLVVCQNDILFVSGDYRKGATGLRLMRDTERAASALGAKLMLWHAKPETNLHAVLPRLKYRVQDVVYSRVL